MGSGASSSTCSARTLGPVGSGARLLALDRGDRVLFFDELYQLPRIERIDAHLVPSHAMGVPSRGAPRDISSRSVRGKVDGEHCHLVLAAPRIAVNEESYVSSRFPCVPPTRRFRHRRPIRGIVPPCLRRPRLYMSSDELPLHASTRTEPRLSAPSVSRILIQSRNVNFPLRDGKAQVEVGRHIIHLLAHPIFCDPAEPRILPEPL